MATIGSLVFKIGADTGEIIDGVNKVNSKLSTMPQELEKVQSRAATWGSFVGNVMADVAAKVGRLAVDAIGDLIARSEKMSSVGSAFDRLSGSVGETGEAFLKVTRTATKGLISDLDLMQAANKGVLLGLPITSSSFGKLAETAITLGRAMGQGPNKSLDDLIIGLGRSSPLILDNLGLTVKVGEANDKYAAQLGKSSASLTDAEKKTAFYNATMEAAGRKVQELGGIQERSIDGITRVKVAWDNLLNKVADIVAKSPAVQTAMDAASKAVEGWIRSLSDTNRAASGVNGAILMIVEGMNGFLGVINVIQTAFNGFQRAIAEGFKWLADSTTMLPATLSAISPALGNMAGGLLKATGAFELARGASLSFGEISRQQGEDYTRNANAIESAQDKLSKLAVTLRSTSPAIVDNSTALDEHANKLRDNAGGAAAFGKTIEDMGLKIGNGFGLIKQHTSKVDIKEVMDKSIDSFRNVKVAADQSVPGFVSVGKAATSLFDDLKKSTAGVMGLSSALSSFSGSQFGANFGSSMGFGQGMSIGVQGNISQAQIQQYYRSLGFFHSGGGIGFSGMKRYHSGGLMQGEVPIVAQEGEGILSRRGMAALSRLNGGGSVGGASVSITINAQGAFFDTPDAKERLARMVGDAVVAKMKSQGARI